MKIKSILLVLFCLCSAAHSTPLSSAMKSMNKLLKQIKKDVTTQERNATTIEAATKLLALLDSSAQQIPDSIETLPEPQRTTAIRAFKSLISEEAKAVNTLLESLRANNNSAAERALAQMIEIEKRGHKEFK